MSEPPVHRHRLTTSSLILENNMTTGDETNAFADALQFLHDEKEHISIKISESFDSNSEECKILDLGSHRGELVALYIGKIREKYKGKLHITCVEIDKSAVAKFLPAAEFGPGVELRVIHSGFEEFLNKTAEIYDFIIASHSFYWLKNFSEMIENLLNRGRKIFIVLRGESGTCQIQKHLEAFMSNPVEVFYTAETLEEELLSRKSTYSTIVFDISIAVPTESLAFAILAGFLFQQPNSLISEQALQALRDYLGNASAIREPNTFFCIDGRHMD